MSKNIVNKITLLPDWSIIPLFHWWATLQDDVRCCTMTQMLWKLWNRATSPDFCSKCPKINPSNVIKPIRVRRFWDDYAMCLLPTCDVNYKDRPIAMNWRCTGDVQTMYRRCTVKTCIIKCVQWKHVLSNVYSENMFYQMYVVKPCSLFN